MFSIKTPQQEQSEYSFIRNVPKFEPGLQETENNKFSFLSPAFRKEG